MKSFLDLEAAKSAMELVEEVYRLTRMLPKEETYGIASQLKRAATSIVANIAEGFGRYTFPDKARHYLIARGECSEVTAYVLITVRVKLLTSKNTQHALELADRTGRLLSGLIASCKERAA
ncbi:MAG: four helix bundle protein [Candidatus Peribacteraceae bacterium]|nr:four helix bundle protein [Candidatus Peribacteraceae bacterium]